MTYLADRGILLNTQAGGPELDVRRRVAPAHVEPHGYFWDGYDRASSIVTVTGSQTITPDPTARSLTVSGIASQSANDVNAILFPVTIATGQTWACSVSRDFVSGAAFLMSLVLITDGTSASANLAAAVAYNNSANNNLIFQGFNSTLTAANPQTTANTLIAEASGKMRNAAFLLALTYISANTFQASIGSVNGIPTASTTTATFTNPSLNTPTHVGIGWSIWGTTPTSNVCKFGPLYRVA